MYITYGCEFSRKLKAIKKMSFVTMFLYNYFLFILLTKKN
jgi:hypothetical protein